MGDYGGWGKAFRPMLGVPPTAGTGSEAQSYAIIAHLQATLRERGVPRDGLPVLAWGAAIQWTGTFNPRPFDAEAALALYERAF